MKPHIDLLVLDAHGVVLNTYWPRFLRSAARHTGEPVEQVLHRWHHAVRADAWLGRIGDSELWRRLLPAGGPHHDWPAMLEAGYTLGPAAPHLERWTACVPVWLLSNHRSHWLRPRLERFGLASCFEQVLVSDMIGAAKPDASAFDPLLRLRTRPEHILFVDDQIANVTAARRLGLQAVHVETGGAWVASVDSLLLLYEQWNKPEAGKSFRAERDAHLADPHTPG
jgi:putative hydrolase of the HAD superfamily